MTDTESKTKTLIRQFIKYFGVALVGYAVDFGFLLLFKEVLGLHYLVAASIGFVGGLIVVYILSNKFVFGESKIASAKVQFAAFALTGIIGLLLLNLLMWIFTDIFGVVYIASKIVATVFVYIWNFFARRALYKN